MSLFFYPQKKAVRIFAEKNMEEVNPKETTRAYAFDMWMKAPMPMVTLFKTLDVRHLVNLSRKNKWKFNMLMCWCIGKAASQIKEFYMLPVNNRLVRYDKIAVNTIVANQKEKSVPAIFLTPKICTHSMNTICV